MQEKNFGYIIVTQHGVVADGKTDVSQAVQKIIDENPNRTIFFPDGTYLLKSPIATPADPVKSVDLRLSNYAIIKASEDWDVKQGAIVRLGGKDACNCITTCGSNYTLSGGIIDGSGVADGVSIESGRETRIMETSIKNVRRGIHIFYGANCGSSDADVMNVHIVGNGALDSIGVLCEGFDNSFTNMRIANVQIGFHLIGAGNFLRHIHPLYTSNYEKYQESYGFLCESNNNFLTNCYSDHFAIGFRINGFQSMNSCFCFWYNNMGEKHTAISSVGAFNACVTNLVIGFRDEVTKNVVLATEADGGLGVIDHLSVNQSICTDETYKQYLRGQLFEA